MHGLIPAGRLYGERRCQRGFFAGCVAYRYYRTRQQRFRGVDRARLGCITSTVHCWAVPRNVPIWAHRMNTAALSAPCRSSAHGWMRRAHRHRYACCDPAKPATALVDGVIIARYLQGKSGTALVEGVTSRSVDMTALETQLAAVTTGDGCG